MVGNVELDGGGGGCIADISRVRPSVLLAPSHQHHHQMSGKSGYLKINTSNGHSLSLPFTRLHCTVAKKAFSEQKE